MPTLASLPDAEQRHSEGTRPAKPRGMPGSPEAPGQGSMSHCHLPASHTVTSCMCLTEWHPAFDTGCALIFLFCFFFLLLKAGHEPLN